MRAGLQQDALPSFWHFARTVVALRHLHLTESRSSAVVPAVGVLTVFLAVTVVVLTVKAGLSALVLCTFLMIHFAALLPNTVVTKAVWVFAVGLAVRIVLPRTYGYDTVVRG